MRLRSAIFPALLLLSLSCNGCALRTVITTDKDIFQVKKGSKIGDKEIDRDGYFVSNFYLKEVIKTKTK